MKMHRYSRIRGSRSADFEEPKWKQDYSTDLSPMNGSAKGPFNDSSHNSKSRQQIQRKNSFKEQGFVEEIDPIDPSDRAGFILGRALSLKETIKDKKFMKKGSNRAQNVSDTAVKSSGNNNSNGRSLQGAVKRVFSMRKSAPDQDRLNPHADFLSADEGFKRSESLRYCRIDFPPPLDLHEDGSTVKKKKKSVFKTCKRLLGMQRN